MQWDQIRRVLMARPLTFIGFLAASLGGLILAYSAAFTVWAFHRTWGSYLPRPEAVLIAATISLTVTGASYLTLRREEAESLSPIFTGWWILLASLSYGVLIAMGVKTPVISQR